MRDHCPRLQTTTTNTRPPDRTPSPSTPPKKKARGQKEKPQITKCFWETDEGLCRFVAETAGDLASHIETNHKGNRMCHWRDCPPRKLPFNNDLKWIDHVRRHIGYCPFVCELCPYKFPEKEKLVAHLKKHHSIVPKRKNKSAPSDTCAWEENGVKCGFVAENGEVMASHILSCHVKRNEWICFWKGCVRRNPIYSEEDFINHVNGHIGIKPFKCSWCDKEFALEHWLILHRNEKHSDLEVLEDSDENDADWSKTPLCLWSVNDQVCLQQFNTPAELHQHVRAEHLQQITDIFCYWKECRGIHKPFRSRAHVVQHLHKHTKYTPFQCQFCVKQSSTSSNLNTHYREFHRDRLQQGHASSSDTEYTRFQCQFCNKRTTTSSNLKDHYERYHRKRLQQGHVSDGMVPLATVQINPDTFGNSTIGYPAQRHQDEFNSAQYLSVPTNYPSSSVSYTNGPEETTYPDVTEENICMWYKNGTLCGRSFESALDLFNHLTANHSEDLICFWMNCRIYGGPFKCSRTIKRHLLFHANYLPHKCSICQLVFPDSWKLVRHKKSTHPDRMLANAPVGLLWSEEELELKRKHREEKNTPEARKCSKCGDDFIREGIVLKDSHIQCWWLTDGNVCKQWFAGPIELSTHIHAAHILDYDNKQCSWEDCLHATKPFPKRADLEKHIRLHTGLKKFLCRYCYKGHDSEITSNAHVKIHTECSKCRHGVVDTDVLEYEYYEVDGQEIVMIEDDGEELLLMEQPMHVGHMDMNGEQLVQVVEYPDYMNFAEEALLLEDIVVQNVNNQENQIAVAENLDEEEWILQEL